jgi:hypothetical protein
MQVGDATVKPGAVLHFDYEWESSTGDLADLSDCKVGEYVKYPGSADPYNWPSPPWDGSGTPNPTILWVDATDGRAQDNHSSKGFLKPYESATFAAQQKYRFKCGSKTTVFSGWSRVIISRRVWDRTGRGCWTYKITKSGAEASERLPGVTNAKCTGAAPMTVAQGLPDFKNGGGEIGMSVSLPDASVGLHEPIFADLTIFNRRHNEVEVDLGLNGKANLELTITTPAGNVETRKLSSEGFGGAGAFVLAPGGTFKKTLVLNEWYNFPEPGTYRITMTLVDGSSAAGTDRASTNFSVQIGQRNPARLRDIATGLADKAIIGATYAERREPANALSFIDDPVAVDSLVRVLHRGSLVEHFAVNGLGRIGTPKAIAALVAAAHNHPDEDVRAAASSTLRARERRGQGGSRPAD